MEFRAAPVSPPPTQKEQTLPEYMANSSLAAALWRRTLSRIPTTFGRLAHLASLRQPGGVHYEHPALANTLGPQDADRILRRSHYQVFAQWLDLSLEEQKSDLEEYLRETGAPESASRFRELVPPNALDVERQLYLTDLETLLELLRLARGDAPPRPGA